MKIHLVCRGNAFRSVIAEAYLNSLHLKGVKASSSGTVAETYKEGNRVSFPKTLALLRRHGVEGFAKPHHADQLTQGLLNDSDLVIFLHKRAYDEARQEFKLPEKTLVWNVVDLGEKGRIATTEAERDQYSEDVYVEIAGYVDKIAETLRSGKISA